MTDAPSQPASTGGPPAPAEKPQQTQHDKDMRQFLHDKVGKEGVAAKKAKVFMKFMAEHDNDPEKAKAALRMQLQNMKADMSHDDLKGLLKSKIDMKRRQRTGAGSGAGHGAGRKS